ncbi:MAG: histidinol-phosphate transaminase [bacterium]
MIVARKNIEKLEPYTPGYQPQDAQALKLNTNENPYPPSKHVLEAIENSARGSLRLYPDPTWRHLRRKASDVYKIGEDYIFFGNGSDEVLSLIFRAFIGKNDSVIAPYPTYSYYEVMAHIQEARFKYFDTDASFRIPLDKLKECGAKIVCFSNPNTPTGLFITKNEIEQFLEDFSGLCILDEAYIDFAPESAYQLVSEYNNCIVVRTFSKSFSLCGIRVGYCFADPALISVLLKVKESYNINTISQIAAQKALEDIEYMRANSKKIIQVREQYTEVLKKLGFFVIPSASNFIFVKHEKVPARELYEYLFNQNVFVRYFDLRRIDEYLRITIGTEEQMQRFIAEISKKVSVA